MGFQLQFVSVRLVVWLLPCDQEVIGSSRGNNLWQKCKLPLLLRSFFAFVFCTSFIVRVLCEGIPEQAEIPPVARAPAMNAPASGQAVNASAQKASQPAVPSSGPDANPLDLFPQLWLVIIEIHTVESKSNKNSTDNS
ncbi:hypothetical protein FXO38_07772 [Capsicum annuum]|nr:hypothetical protein FXO38_07772 [Capsicum annuum]